MSVQLNKSAGLARVTLAKANATAFLSESVCRAHFTPDRHDVSFQDLLTSNARQIRAAVWRRSAVSAQSTFVLRPADF
ncbi:hypothetical protein [Sphaerotilus sp.]|uniref:hypothetical protein n=1 Tax=Sphaerotilus sp. TaxID=2093942 RepID=UPI002ACEE41C|nr:hypothetical protein [Sphaerotilus sp.]MDZ7858643.1 hypothetical protein [Sphaerotilus sp.]